MTDQNRPRHSRGSDGGSFDNPTYDDAYSFPGETAGAAAGTGGTAGAAGEAGVAGTGAAAASASGGTGGAGGAGGTGGAGPEKSGPPLRGFAMILTAVAVVLIVWGAFSLFGGDDGDDTAAGAGRTAATAPGAQAPAATPAAPAEGSAAAPAAGSDAAAPSAGAAPSEGADAAGAAGGSAAPAAPAAPAASGEVTVDRGTAVTVLNNSKDRIGQSTADDLKGKDWTSVSAANLAGNVSTYQSSGVYYPAGDAQAKADAEALASDLGLSAVERTAADDANFAKATDTKGEHADVAGVVVVLTEAP